MCTRLANLKSTLTYFVPFSLQKHPMEEVPLVASGEEMGSPGTWMTGQRPGTHHLSQQIPPSFYGTALLPPTASPLSLSLLLCPLSSPLSLSSLILLCPNIILNLKQFGGHACVGGHACIEFHLLTTITVESQSSVCEHKGESYRRVLSSV